MLLPCRPAVLALPAILLLCAFGTPIENPFPKIAEIVVNERLAAVGEPAIPDPKIQSAAFSPDGTRLALDVDASYLLIVETANPTKVTYWTKLPQSQELALDALAWAPDGNSLVDRDTLIHPAAGTQCSFTDRFAGFLNSTLFLVSAQRGNLNLQVMDSQCNVHDQWMGDRRFNMTAVSPDGHMMALVETQSRPDEFYRARITLLSTPVDPAVPAPMFVPGAVPARSLDLSAGRTIKLSEQVAGSIVLEDGSVCSALNPNSQTRPPGIAGFSDALTALLSPAEVACWNTQTGKLVHKSPAAWTGLGLQLSAGGGKIAVADSGYGAFAATTGGMAPAPQTHGVWDPASGKMIASWSMGPGEKVVPGRVPTRRAFVISPDGHLLAEAVRDSVRLYRVP